MSISAAPSALHSQLSETIATDIRNGAIKHGDRLPSERELAERFKVSRVTVRRALIDLASRGIVESQPGRGTFVTSRVLSEDPNSLVSFSELGQQRGLAPSSLVRKAAVSPASLEEAEEFGIAPGSEVFLLERVRLFDSYPVSIDLSRVPLARAPGLQDVDFRTASLYAALDERGCGPVAANYVLQAVSAGSREAEFLNVAVGDPLLQSKTTSFDIANRVVEVGLMVYRADRYQFRARLTRAPYGE